MTISYAIPVCNESTELDRLIDFLNLSIRNEDEIVILCDKGNTTQEVKDIISKHKLTNVYYNSLNKDFAQQKNYLTKMCKGNWIFLIDADEIPNKYLIETLPIILESNSEVEAYWVPRINTVNGLTPQHIQKWGWRVDEKGWINFPDWQMRIYKNDSSIHWTKPVHEQLVGYKKYAQLPTEENFCLYHPKEIDRQERQNSLYETI